jgi:hypothetical protein
MPVLCIMLDGHNNCSGDILGTSDRRKMTVDEMLIEDWKKLIGYTVLVKIRGHQPTDALVNKVAPKSGYVEFVGQGWFHIDRIELLDVLD